MTERLAGFDMLNWKVEGFVVFRRFWDKYMNLVYQDCSDVMLDLDFEPRGLKAHDFWSRYGDEPWNYVLFMK